MSEVAYAGFWRRAGAHLIDSLIYLPIASAVLYGVYGPEYFVTAPENPFAVAGVWDVVMNNLLPLALVVWLWHRYGATPGKQLLHLKVIDADSGRKPGWGQSTLRYFAYLASALPLGLGFLWVIWDRRRQGFHDKIARTLVIYHPEDEAQKSLAQLVKESGE